MHTCPPPRAPAVLPSPEGLAALEAQRHRVRAVKASVNEIKADRGFMRASKAFNKQAAKAAALLERAALLRGELAEQQDSSWRAFEDLLAILTEAGALEGVPDAAADPAAPVEQAVQQQLAAGSRLAAAAPELASAQPQEGQQQAQRGAGAGQGSSGAAAGTRVGFTPLGRVAREVNCANELWLALVLTHEALQQLEPPQLAAVLSAIVAGESVSRPTVWTAYSATEPVTAAVLALEEPRTRLAALQVGAWMVLLRCGAGGGQVVGSLRTCTP